MILWFYSNKFILVFLYLLTQGSWNPFNFLRGASFVLMRWLWVDSWITLGWGLVTRKTDLGLEAWGFEPHLHPPGKGRGWRLSECLSCPPKEASPTVPTAEGEESFLAADTSTFSEGYARFMGTETAVLGSSQTSPWGHCFTRTLIYVLYHTL